MGFDNLIMSSVSCVKISSNDKPIYILHEYNKGITYYTSDGTTWETSIPKLQQAISIQKIVSQAEEAIKEMEQLLKENENPFELKGE